MGPKSCSWGEGIYAGTLLLYAQDIAMNQLWTQDYNMTNLDITNVRDYSMFMALSSHKQGIGQSVAWSNYLQETAGKPLSHLCLDFPMRPQALWLRLQVKAQA